MVRRASIVILLGGMGFFLGACLRTETPPQVMPVATIPPTPVGSAVSPSPFSPPTLAAGLTPTSFEAAAPQESALAALAAELGVPISLIQLVGPPLPVQWNDTSLGCPQPDQVYAQVVTPGYLFTFSYNGVTYQVHTDLGGQAIVCHNNGDPIGSGTVPDPIVAEFIVEARGELAQRLGVPPAEVVLVRSEAVEWTDTSLGCQEPGMTYEQVLTPGYRIVLAVGDQHYEYHTDQQRMILCLNPSE